MKVKTIVTGCNRKQVRSIALEQEARANKAELEVLATETLAAGYKVKSQLANEMLKNTTDELIIKKKALTEAVDKNIELARDIAGLNKTIISLDDQLKTKELNNVIAEEEKQKLQDQVAKLQAALKQSDKDLALAKRPIWKKILKVE